MDDQAVIARVQAGDRDSFRMLVDRYSQSVFRLAWRMTGNEQDAEEVVQESFLRAYRQIGKYESRASFGTWVYRIASNYALDMMRARRRMGRHTAPLPEDHTDLMERLPTEAPGADRLVFSGQVGKRIEEAMAELSEQERTAFVLRHYEGQSIEEIGQALSLNANATKNSIFRAVQKLRRALAPVAGARMGVR
jgi:RNA polymerase sigma-70 factor (ECF subfamily)